MREYDEHDDLNDRTGSHGKCRWEPVDVFECGQLYYSGGKCNEQYKRKLGHLRERHVYKRDNNKSDLYPERGR
jgi:hypothetical protein